MANGDCICVQVADIRALGAVIRQRRKSLGLRQDAVALAAGVGVMFVSALERGKPSAEVEKVLAVLNAVGIDICLKARA
jgi:y4mF family transcriptional regulator